MKHLMLCAGLCVCVLAALAPTAEPSQSLRIDVQLGQTVATVTGPDGHFVTDLKPEDFIVELDGAPQSIVHFTRDEETSITLGLLLDQSPSMRLKFDAARDAAGAFIKGMRQTDELFLMTFAGEHQLRQDLTTNREELLNALKGVRNFSPGTNLFPAVLAAGEKAKTGRHRKRALIVITDAGDTSQSNLADFQQELRRAEVLMYAIDIQGAEPQPVQVVPRPVVAPQARDLETALDASRGAASENRNPSRRSTFPRVARRPPVAPRPMPQPRPPMTAADRQKILESISGETGGKWFPLNADQERKNLGADLTEIFSQISAELRAQYSIGFYPTSQDVGVIRVRMKDPSYNVRWRR